MTLLRPMSNESNIKTPSIFSVLQSEKINNNKLKCYSSIDKNKNNMRLNSLNFTGFSFKKKENVHEENFDYVMNSQDLSYVKNIKREENEIRKLISQKKKERVESITNYHYDTLRLKLRNKNNFYITGIPKNENKKNLVDLKSKEIKILLKEKNVYELKPNITEQENNTNLIESENKINKGNILITENSKDENISAEKNKTKNNLDNLAEKLISSFLNKSFDSIKKEKKNFILSTEVIDKNNSPFSKKEDLKFLKFHRIRSKSTRNIIKPSICLFRDTLYPMKNDPYLNIESIKQKEIEKLNKNKVTNFEKLLIKINSLFTNQFESKQKFVNKIRETFMINNNLKQKNEHTRQMEEFYITKVDSYEDSKNSIKKAEDLFILEFLAKFDRYTRAVSFNNEVEKQNLKNLNQKKNNLDLDIYKLTSEINKAKERVSIYTEYRNFMICVKEKTLKAPKFFYTKVLSQEELIQIARKKLLLVEKQLNPSEHEKITKQTSIASTNFLNNTRLAFANKLENNGNVNFDFFGNSKKKISLFTGNVNNGLINSISNLKNVKPVEKIIKPEPLDPETFNLLNKEKEEYTRYLNYIIKPIFNNFDEFYSQLKKLEKENLNLLNKKNENSLNLNNQRLELFKIKADEESQNAKNKKELFKSQKNLEEVKLKNQDLKDKLNRLILKIKKDNIPKIKKEKSNYLSKSSKRNNNVKEKNYNNTNNNFNTLNNFSDSNGFPKKNNLFSTFSSTSGFENNSLNLEIDKKNNISKPKFYFLILDIFNLINEVQKFIHTNDEFKNMTYDDYILLILHDIEIVVNLLLNKYDMFKKNPILRIKLNEVTVAIEKDNRARKAADQMKKNIEDYQKMIERVNYKFYRINLLPKRKCPGRYRPKDDNKEYSYDLNNLKHKHHKGREEEYDFLDII